MIDEATRQFLAGMPAPKPLTDMTLDEIRAMGAAVSELYSPGPPMASTRDFTISSADGTGTIPVRMLVPSDAPTGLLVYLHGGGWVMGSVAETDSLAREIAAQSGAAILLVEYRLAPEHPYPAAVDDAWAAVRWAADNVAAELGTPLPVAVAGDSSGGNLAAAVAQRAQAAQLELALQVLIYPVLSADLDTPSYVDPDNQLILDRASMRWFWDQYAAPERRGEPEASPAAADLTRQCPAVIVLAEHDVLRDEGERYADALRAAGVLVEVRTFPEQMHMFFTLVGLLPAGAEARRFVSDRIHQAFAARRSATPAT